MKAPLARTALAAALALAAVWAPALHAEEEPPAGTPDASIDLASREGVSLVSGAWRYHDTRIVEVEHRAPDAEGQPTGAPIRTYDFTPHAGSADFDDSGWPVIDPTTLAQRRGAGRLCFNWYRITLTVPERIGSFDPSGATVVFETALDDYAEVWVDGELPRLLGQRGGSVVAGWNAPNRLVVGRHVKPGQRIQLAVFGANGPLSNPPANFIWVRYARLDFYRADGERMPRAIAPREVNVEIERLDPALGEIVPANPKIHKLAEGFLFTEGPVWAPPGRLLFSDPNANTIYEYQPEGEGTLRVFRAKSGYDGADIAEYGQPGSNGLALDREGRLTIDQHGNRRVVRLEADGQLRTLADRFEDRRLNSPNDLVYRSDGSLYFTDPPFGLPKFAEDPRKELPFSGVYRWKDGTLTLLDRELTGPNGIAFSPDETQLYVGNWDPERKLVMRYPVRPDGSVGEGSVFFDMTAAKGEDAIDGIEVDRKGNLYVSGPGGLWVLSPQGKHLGTIRPPQHPHNFAWGDADGRTLYLAARSGLYSMRLGIPGAGH